MADIPAGQPAGGKHLDSIARVRADWQAKGYTITDDRETGTDDGIVQSRTPDGFTILFTRTTGAGFAVIIHSPCFERPDSDGVGLVAGESALMASGVSAGGLMRDVSRLARAAVSVR